MPLAIGRKAPDFTLSTKTADGPKQVRLSDNFGKRNTLLLFFPMAFTGTCTTEMCEVSQGMNAYTGSNAVVYGISGDNKKAKEIFEYGLSKDDKYPMFYYNLACAHAEMNDMENAIKNLRFAVKYIDNLIPGEQLPDPSGDDSFKRFLKNEQFQKALREMSGKSN